MCHENQASHKGTGIRNRDVNVANVGCSAQAPPAEVLHRRRVRGTVREALGLPRLLVRVHRRRRVPGGLQQEVPALQDRYTVHGYTAILDLAQPPITRASH